MIYRSDIDGIRAIAVLSVIGFHFFPSLIVGGFIGVDVFFVISGFLISTIIMQKLSQGEFSYVDFYTRRIKRIFPALLIILTTTIVIGWFVMFPNELMQLGKHLAGGATFTSNLLLAREIGYFDIGSANKPLLHLWSLGIEEQYYILWPIFISILFKTTKKIFFVISLVFLSSFLLNVLIINKHANYAFYLPLTRIWELTIGSLLAYYILFGQKNSSLTARNYLVSNSLSFFGMLCILISLFMFGNEKIFQSWLALLPTLGAFMLIFAGSGSWINRKILASQPFVFFGLISYPLYLWHWPLLAFLNITQNQISSLNIRIMFVVISILLAWLTYKFIEQPIRIFNGKNYQIAASLMIFLFLIGGVGLSLYKNNGYPNRFPIETRNFLNDLSYDTSKFKYYPCPNDLFKSKPELSYCLQSQSPINSQANLVIFGDSHADHIFHGISKVDINHNWMLIGNYSCPPVNDIFLEADVPNCYQRNANIINYLKKQKHIETVVLAFFGNYFQETDFAADHMHRFGPSTVKIKYQNLNKTQAFQFGLEKTITELEIVGKKIVIVLDVPELPFFSQDCISRLYSSKKAKNFACFISKKTVLTRQKKLRLMLTKIQSSHPNIKIFDPLNFLCNEDKCWVKRNDILVYRDSHHLSLSGSELFAAHFIPWLNTA